MLARACPKRSGTKRFPQRAVVSIKLRPSPVPPLQRPNPGPRLIALSLTPQTTGTTVFEKQGKRNPREGETEAKREGKRAKRKTKTQKFTTTSSPQLICFDTCASLYNPGPSPHITTLEHTTGLHLAGSHLVVREVTELTPQELLHHPSPSNRSRRRRRRWARGGPLPIPPSRRGHFSFACISRAAYARAH